jgi:hypothetical protein
MDLGVKGNAYWDFIAQLAKLAIESDALSRFRKFRQQDKWKGCSPRAIKMAEMRSNDDATSTPEPHIGL